MSSNIKPKPNSKEAPTEPFKRSVAACLRAIARKPELDVTYAAERPGMVGGKARLPEPARKLTAQEAAIVRGYADSIALRVACHDANVHRRAMPTGQQGRAVFEAVEQARVEAIGARRMQGVAKNLSAMLDDRFHRGKFDDITDRADAPIEDAVALMVRERLTGQAPPPAARKLVELWRPFIEEKAGKNLDRLEKLVENQRRFGDVVHDLLDSLEMGDDRPRVPGTVLVPGLSQGIQCHSDGTIADGVDVHLEPLPVHCRDPVAQVLGGVIERPRFLALSGVWLQKSRGAGLDDAIGVKLHRVGREAGAGIALPQLDHHLLLRRVLQPLDLLQGERLHRLEFVLGQVRAAEDVGEQFQRRRQVPRARSTCRA